jgi:hypothetical protein
MNNQSFRKYFLGGSLVGGIPHLLNKLNYVPGHLPFPHSLPLILPAWMVIIILRGILDSLEVQ